MNHFSLNQNVLLVALLKLSLPKTAFATDLFVSQPFTQCPKHIFSPKVKNKTEGERQGKKRTTMTKSVWHSPTKQMEEEGRKKKKKNSESGYSHFLN